MRISDDRDDEREGVARQEADCRALAERLGWKVAEVYPENNRSAFKRRKVALLDGTTAMRVVRPKFRQLLTDLSTGAIDALLAYDLDRIARDPRDIEDLIDVVEQRKIPCRSVTGSLDLSTDSGVTMARFAVIIAHKSSADSSRRIKRKHLELAEKGTYGGGGRRPYGYTRDGMTVIEDEAKVIRQIAAHILDGRSVNSIAQALSAAGVPTVTGVPHWHYRSVHSAVTKPRVAGLREYRGEIVGEAAWPAILDRETWERVRLALAQRRREPTRFRHWLRGVLVCSHCRARMVGWGSGRPVYWCSSLPQHGGCGQMSIVAAQAERTVERMLLDYLSRRDVLDRLRRTTSAESVDTARREMAEDEAQLRELAAMWGRRDITMPEYLAARREIEGRMARAESLVRAAIPGTVRALLAGDLHAGWAGLGPAQRREVAQAVFPRGIEVRPGRPGPFDPDRLVPVD